MNLRSALRSSLRPFALFALTLVASTFLQAQGVGYWHTSGNQILDSNNKTVRIAGLNWYGFETPAQVPGGLDRQDYKTLLNTIKVNGYNTVRIPYSSQMTETPAAGLNIGYSAANNADLAGLNSLQVLDRVVAYAGSIGLRVILDHHRSDAGASAQSNGLWYTSQYPESAWIADWVMLAKRYLNNSSVIGFDLHNEPHSVKTAPYGACWDCGGANDWHLAAQRAGNAILGVNPSLLIFVEGVDTYGKDTAFWGGNLEGVQKSPVVLSVKNHLVYSPHDYGPTSSAQPWFNSATTYSSLVSMWTARWGYISLNNIAPIWIGEFGTGNLTSDVLDAASGSQGQWFQSFIQYLSGQPNLSWSYWALNGEEADALLDPNYDAAPASALKQQFLASLQFPLAANGSAPAVPNGLTATATSTTQIALKWAAVAGTGVTYNVYLGTASGKTTTLSTLGVTGNTVTIGNLNPVTPYYFVLKSVSASGVISAASAQATATTLTPPPPAAPTGLTATATGDTGISLAWKASTTAGSTYTVYQGNTATSVNQIISTGLTTTTFTVLNLTPSTAYFFAVKAVSQTVPSAMSNVATATTKPPVAPAPPTSLTTKVVSSNEIDLAWSPSSSTSNHITYTVYGNGSVIESGLQQTSFQAVGLTSGTSYSFTVVAVEWSLVSPGTNTVTAKTLGITPASCHITYVNSNDWSAGFIGGISITNTGTTPITSWNLTFTFAGNQTITANWSAVLKQTGNFVTMQNQAYNGTIAPKATLTGMGFQATYSGKNAVPAVFTVNGSVCK